MSKQAIFTMKLELELGTAFIAEAEAARRPAREYDVFLQSKVEVSRVSIQDSQGYSNEEIEAEFALRRAHAKNQA